MLHAQTVGCAGETAVGSVNLPISQPGLPGFVALFATRGEHEGGYLSPGGWIYDRFPQRHEFMILPSLPASFRFDFCIPELRHSEWFSEPILVCSQTSFFAAGFNLHATYGVLTPEIQADADRREAMMIQHNQRLVASGRAPREFDKQRWTEALVMRGARDRVVQVMTIPGNVDCRPPDTGGGN